MARPMMLGAVALAGTLYVCARSWTRGDRSVAIVPAVVIAWTFVHSTAILGLALVAIFALSALVVRHPARRWFAVAAAVTLVACAALPSARGRFAVAAGLEGSRLAIALTTEWTRTSLGDRELWIPLAGTLAAVFVVLRSAERRRAALPYLGAVALAVAVAARFSRNLYEAIVLAAPLCAIAVERAATVLAARSARAGLYVALVVGLVLPAVHVRLAPTAFATSFGVGPADGAVPVETLALLRALPAGRVMNDCTLGGWLIWQGVPVYCDGRTVALYREADVERLFLPLYGDAAAIDAVADRYDIHYALARFDSDFERTLMRAPSWLPLAYDREHSLFVRRRYAPSLPRDLVPLDELRYAVDNGDTRGTRWLDAWYRAVAAEPARLDRLQAEAVAAVARCPTSRTLHAALVYLDRAQPAIAERLKRALEKN